MTMIGVMTGSCTGGQRVICRASVTGAVSCHLLLVTLARLSGFTCPCVQRSPHQLPQQAVSTAMATSHQRHRSDSRSGQQGGRLRDETHVRRGADFGHGLVYGVCHGLPRGVWMPRGIAHGIDHGCTPWDTPRLLEIIHITWVCLWR